MTSPLDDRAESVDEVSVARGACAQLLSLLDERRHFEQMLARLSATFIHLPADAVDGQIELGLRQLVEYLGVDRSSVAQFTDDGAQLRVTHSYAVAGIERMAQFDLAAVWPWYTEQVRRGDCLRYSRLPEDAPPEAVLERAYCARSGLRAHLMIPFRVGAEVIGGLGFGSFQRECAWPDDLVESLQTVGAVFANALARQRAEQRTAQLREQLARAARVTLLGELAASIAHEINQPLCAIVSNAQAAQRLLDAASPDLAEVRAALRDVADDGRRAAAVLGRIRDSLRQAPPERAPIDVNDLIHAVVALAQPRLAGRGVAVRLELAEGLPPVPGDRVQLQQVVLNLLVNGADAQEGAAGPHELTVRTTAGAAGGVTVAVSDAGAGFAPGEAERVFDAFYTTKPDGMGMGLAISRSIVEAHGGRIVAHANEDRGATVTFTLPASMEAARG